MSLALPLNVLADLVRLKLYEAIVVHDKMFVDIDFVVESFERKFTRALIVSALRQIETSKHLMFDSEANKRRLGLTPMGVRAVEKALANPESAASRFTQQAFEAFEPEMIVVGGVPASDRIVSIDHNSVEYDKASEAIKSAKRVLREDNAVGAALGDDRDLALAEINQLEQVIREPRVKLSILRAYVQKSLPWLGEKSAGTILAEITKSLYNILKNWLI